MAGKYYVPSIGSFLIYLVMVSLLMWRPAGLFGETLTVSVTSARRSIRTHCACATQVRWRWIEIVFWLATLLPFVADADLSRAGSQIAITALFALSLDLILGYAGIVSLGHAAFFGFGAYTAGLHLQVGLGRAADSGLVDRRASPPGVLGYAHELHHRALPASRADHDDARPRPAAVRSGQQRAAGSPAAPTACRASRCGRCSACFKFDLYGYTAYAYSLLVLFLVFLVARRLINSPFGLSLRGIRENAAPHAGDRRAEPRAHPHDLHDLRGRSPASPARCWRRRRETVSLDVLELPALGRRAGDADPRRRRPALRRARSARSSTWSRATSSPASIRSTGISGSALLLIAVVMFLPNGILGGLAQLTPARRGRGREPTPRSSTRGLNKSFGSLVVANDIELDAAAGRALRADRPERRRQDHADQSDDRHAAAGRRPDLARRRGHHRAAAASSGSSAGSCAPSRSTRCFRI